jgi:hypothetical protein
VARAQLEALGVDWWLLGHIHKPGHLSVGNPLGYLGSLAGTDPGEPGAHGPWLLSTHAGVVDSCSQIVLAPLRWETLEVDLSTTRGSEDAEQLLVRRIGDYHAVTDLGSDTRAVGLRVILTGSTSVGAACAQALEENAVGNVVHEADGTRYFLEKVTLRTKPRLELAEIAGRADPAGILAQRLLLLERGEDDPERIELVARAGSRLESISAQARFAPLQTPLTDEEVIEALRAAGTRLLENMLAQVSGGAA